MEIEEITTVISDISFTRREASPTFIANSPSTHSFDLEMNPGNWRMPRTAKIFYGHRMADPSSNVPPASENRLSVRFRVRMHRAHDRLHAGHHHRSRQKPYDSDRDYAGRHECRNGCEPG